MKPVIAAIKAYRGGEWFGACLESIAPFVQGIVVAISRHPWDASLNRPENCSQPLEEFRGRHPEIPIVAEMVDYRNHEQHQIHCLKMVANTFGSDVTVLTPDTDEVWAAEDLRELLRFIDANPGKVYLSAIWDYLRSPYWRIDNAAGASFIAALSSPVPSLPFRTTSRAWGRREDRVPVPGIRFHHFCFVREDETEIPEKMHLCEVQDGAYQSGWFAETWSKLPAGKNLHPAIGCGKVWPAIEIISRNELPAVLEETAASKVLLDRYASTAKQRGCLRCHGRL